MKIFRPIVAAFGSIILLLPVAIVLFSHGQIPIALLIFCFLGFLARAICLWPALRSFQRNRFFSQDLFELMPKSALVYIDNDIESQSDIDAVREGHLVRLQGQEVIPVDGFISFGSGFIDESPLTGNKEPVLKSMGSPVFTGTKSNGGALLIRAERVKNRSYLYHLAEQLLVTPSTVTALTFEVICVSIASIVYFSSPQPSLLVFLFSPTVFYIAINWRLDLCFRARASALGCIWKPHVAKLFRSKVVVTGKEVLIEKKVRLTEICGIGLSEDSALRLLGPLARRVENEPAFAVLQEIKLRNIPLEILEVYMDHPEGKCGVLAGDQLCWIESPKAIPDELKDFCQSKNEMGERLVYLELNGKISAAAAFEETIQPNAKKAIQNLKSMGFDYILTHKDKVSVSKLAAELGISHVSDLSEELFQKLETEGLDALWFGKEVKLNAIRYGIFEDCEASVLEGDLQSLVQSIYLAQTYLKFKKIVQICTILFFLLGISLAYFSPWSLVSYLVFLPLSILPATIYSLKIPESN